MKSHITVDYEGVAILGFFAVIIIFLVTMAAAFFTHMVWVVSLLVEAPTLTAGNAVLCVIGTLLPPIGVVHGFIIWFS